MLRIRLDGSSIQKDKFKNLINLAKEHNLKLIITARAGFELHKIKPESILKIYKQVKEIGFITHQSLTDNIRAITLDPYDSIAQDSYIECYPLAEQIKKEILNNPKYFGMLPRKFNTSLIGRVEPLINPWGNDLLFALAKGNKGYGFNIYLGGKNSEVAKSVNIFIEPKDTKKMFIAIVDTFIEYGLRGSRSKTRIFHLIEEIGIEKLRSLIEQKFGAKLENEQPLIMKSSKYKHSTELKNREFAKILECNYGEINLDKALLILQEYNNLRVGIDQNLHIIGINNSQKNKSSSIIACAGARYCPLSLWDIKNDIKELNLEQFQKEEINIGFSGCLKGCGRHHHNHIGLVGLRSNMFGPTQRALRVFIGASELPTPTPARLLYYAVPQKSIDKLFRAIINEYKEGSYKDFNAFNIHLNQFKIETLQLWFLLRELTTIPNSLIKLFHTKNSETELLQKLKELNIYPKNKELYDSINILSHKLWDS